MRLYHGSKIQSEILKPNQATAPSDPERAKLIPEKELMNAVYLTPDFEFALAMAARPEGLTDIDITEDKKSVTFEHPELFDPSQTVYIYEVDGSNIPKEFLEKVDEKQYVFTGNEGLKPLDVKQLQARELLKYFELTNWKENFQTTKEQKPEFRR